MSPSVLLLSDGGGKVTAATRPIDGAEKVVKFLDGVSKKGAAGTQMELASLNGQEAVLIRHPDGSVLAAGILVVRGGKIEALYFDLNPDKLAAVAKGGA